MVFEFLKLPQLVDMRGETLSDGQYKNYGIESKTDIAQHHSLTDEGDSASFARYHVRKQNWPGVAYHFVILKDGTIEWNHSLGIRSFHVGKYNTKAVGICTVGDFRYYEPTEVQKKSVRALTKALEKDLPNYERTLGHNEYQGYEWKSCPCFDYEAVINASEVTKPANEKLFRIKTGTFRNSTELSNAKVKLLDDYNWTIYELATDLEFNPYYRLVTGTFEGKNVAEYYADKLRDEYGWTVYVVPA